MTFIDAIKTCFNKYFDFNGRARRSEYWNFFLFNWAVNILLTIIFGSDSFVISLFSVAVFLPGLAVAVRRLHDIGKSGWSLLIALIPLAGIIILLVWYAREGEAGANMYGEDPKGMFAGAQTAEYAPVQEAEEEPAPAEPAYVEPEPVSAEEYDPFSKENIQANYGPKFCTSCGAELKPGQKFCEYCGTKI